MYSLLLYVIVAFDFQELMITSANNRLITRIENPGLLPEETLDVEQKLSVR